MLFGRKKALGDVLKASLLWLALGFSLGWYYLFTYDGRFVWPMPAPEACAGLLLYYFSKLNARPALQIVHWLLAFPIAGVLWVSILAVSAPFFGGRRAEYGWTVWRFSLTALPLALPGPVLAFLAGRTPGGWSWRQMVSVAQGRGGVTPGAWLTYVFLGLAVACLVWQILRYVPIFDLRGKKAGLHLLVCLILLAVMTCGLATLVAVPLRMWLG